MTAALGSAFHHRFAGATVRYVGGWSPIMAATIPAARGPSPL